MGKQRKPDWAKLVDLLLQDLNGRKGFDTGDIDDDTMENWRDDWKEIILTFIEDYNA